MDRHLPAIALALAAFVSAPPASAQGPSALTPPVPDLCTPKTNQISEGACTWPSWAIGKPGVALIADVKTPSTYVICRQGQITDTMVDLMTVADGQRFEVASGSGGQVGFRGGNCATVRGKKIYLTVKSAGANKNIVRGWYKRLDGPGFVSGYRWNAPRNPDGKPYSFAPVLFSPQPMLTRLCFFSDVTDPNDFSTDYPRSRRVLVGPAAYLAYDQASQANFTPGSCADLEYSQLMIDVDWPMDGNSDARGGLFYPLPPSAP